jgi:hypothetical protein
VKSSKKIETMKMDMQLQMVKEVKEVQKSIIKTNMETKEHCIQDILQTQLRWQYFVYM